MRANQRFTEGQSPEIMKFEATLSVLIQFICCDVNNKTRFLVALFKKNNYNNYENLIIPFSPLSLHVNLIFVLFKEVSNGIQKETHNIYVFPILETLSLLWRVCPNRGWWCCFLLPSSTQILLLSALKENVIIISPFINFFAPGSLLPSDNEMSDTFLWPKINLKIFCFRSSQFLLIIFQL